MPHKIWKHVVRSIILGGLFFGAAYSPAVDRFAGDEPISLNVKNEPLGDVLGKIAQATGYQISVSESWADMPVTATFKDVPLQKGLKRILGNTNNAIIYGAGGKIKIVIYDKASAGGRPPKLPAGPSYPQQPDVGSQPVPEPQIPAERDEGTEASGQTPPESSQPAQQSRESQEQSSRVQPQAPESSSGQQDSQSTEETPGQSAEEGTDQQQQQQQQQQGQ
jgi:hypothetical protein